MYYKCNVANSYYNGFSYWLKKSTELQSVPIKIIYFCKFKNYIFNVKFVIDNLYDVSLLRARITNLYYHRYTNELPLATAT